MGFLPVYFYFIVLSFIVSLLVYSGNRYRYIKLFPPFLFVTMTAEFIGSYLFSLGKNNLYIYNFFSVLEFCFYLYVISLLIINQRIKKIIRLTSIFYAIISIVNIVFIQGMDTVHTITYSIGCLIIVMASIYYFYELFRMPKSVRLSRNPAFWICSGLLFFYICGFPLFAFINFWSRFRWVVNSFDSIMMILNIFLYSLFTIGLLCSKPPKFTSSSS
jgi:hypothetical protein